MRLLSKCLGPISWAGSHLSDNLKIIGGVRFETTEFASSGFFLESNTDGLSVTGGPITPISLGSVSKTTSHALPSLNVRWDAREDVVVRASYGRGIKRGDFQDVANRQEIRFDGTVQLRPRHAVLLQAIQT